MRKFKTRLKPHEKGIGFGAQIPMPSWGNLVQEHYHLITGRHAWLALLPGGLIVSVVLAFTFMGDGIREWHQSEN